MRETQIIGVKRIAVAALIFHCSCWLAADESQNVAGVEQRPSEVESHFQKQIQQHVEGLQSDDEELREKAEEALMKLGLVARKQVDAIPSDSHGENEHLQRLKQFFASEHHQLLDALGQPIPFAQVDVTVKFEQKFRPPKDLPGLPPEITQQVTRRIATTTDRDGKIVFGEYERPLVRFTLRHDDFGSGQIETRYPLSRGDLRFPLVKKDSPAYERAVKGKVVSSKQKPIAGAIVACSSVRTSGEGLISARYPNGHVLTNDDGTFALYLPNRASTERGELIPPGSTYELSASLPDSQSVAAVAGRFPNSTPVTLTLNTEGIRYRFAFETLDGIAPNLQELKTQFRIKAESIDKNGRLVRNELETMKAVEGIRLKPGRYLGFRYGRFGTINYAPLEVTEDSHELLTFRLPPKLTFRGRVVDGVTGEPISGAFVAGHYSSGNGSLAMLSANDWKLLYQVDEVTDLESPQLKLLSKYFGARSIVRSQKDGTFRLPEAIDRPLYGVIAFAEGTIPYSVTKTQFKNRNTQEFERREIPLFPAATVTVEPVHANERLGVTPEWVLQKKGQPDWIGRFNAALDRQKGRFKFDSWMLLNTSQPIYIPAGVNVKLRLRTPYAKEVASMMLPDPFQLKPGESHEIGKVELIPTLQVFVRIVNKAGQAVEGIPVRRKHDGERAWSVAHNSDAQGRVQFGINPNSAGQFRAGAFSPNEKQPPIIDFEVGQVAPAREFTIKLTQQQIDASLKRPK